MMIVDLHTSNYSNGNHRLLNTSNYSNGDSRLLNTLDYSNGDSRLFNTSDYSNGDYQCFDTSAMLKTNTNLFFIKCMPLYVKIDSLNICTKSINGILMANVCYSIFI